MSPPPTAPRSRLVVGDIGAWFGPVAAANTLHRGEWNDTLLAMLDVPRAMLPEVKDCAAEFGVTDKRVLGAAIPILGVAGDQQAATIGQACFEPGMLKSTYGTGCFALLNTGEEAVHSKNRLLTTIAYQLDGKRTYALEGSIFIAGAAVQWLRDGLKIIKRAANSAKLAARADPEQAVYLVPAFAGLGAPYWDAEARGAIYGVTRGTTGAEIARAALEAVCYQTRDLLDAMRRDWPQGRGARTVLYRMIRAPIFRSWNHTSGVGVKADVTTPPGYFAC